MEREIRTAYTIKERFFIIKELRGYLSKVFLAFDLLTNKNVIIKFPKDHKISILLIKNEINVLKNLKFHINIANLIDHGVYNGKPFIVTEYLGNETIKTKLNNEKISLIEAIDIFLELADALDYIHNKNYVHRDIKPENVILGERVGLIDFGIASKENQRGIKAGTPPYQCPEILYKKRVTRKCDIYSAGAILYFLLTRNDPKPNFRVKTIIDDIITKSMRVNEDQRYSNIKEMVKDLKSVMPYLFKPRLIIGTKRIELKPNKVYKIGRSRFCDITFKDKFNYLDPIHAYIKYDGKHYRIIDNNTLNGTYVLINNKFIRINEKILKNNDIISLCYSNIKGPYILFKFKHI